MTDTLTIKEAAEACGVSQSTIRRSLERFENAFRVPSATGKPGPWAIPPQDLVTSGFLSELPPELASAVADAADATSNASADSDGASGDAATSAAPATKAAPSPPTNAAARERTGSSGAGSKSTGSSDGWPKSTGSKSTGSSGAGPKSTGSKSTGSSGAGSKSTGSSGAGPKTGSMGDGPKSAPRDAAPKGRVASEPDLSPKAAATATDQGSDAGGGSGAESATVANEPRKPKGSPLEIPGTQSAAATETGPTGSERAADRSDAADDLASDPFAEPSDRSKAGSGSGESVKPEATTLRSIDIPDPEPPADTKPERRAADAVESAAPRAEPQVEAANKPTSEPVPDNSREAGSKRAADTRAAAPGDSASGRRRRATRAEQPTPAADRRSAASTGSTGTDFDVEAALAQILETSQSPGALTFGEMRDLIEQRHLAELDAQASGGELKRVQGDLDRVTKERDLYRADLEQERARADRAERDVSEHRARSEVFSTQVDSLTARLEQLTGDMLRRLVDLESSDFSAAAGADSDHVDALTDRVDQLTAYMLRRLDDMDAEGGDPTGAESAVEVDALTDRLDQLTNYMIKRLDTIETNAQQRQTPQFGPPSRSGDAPNSGTGSGSPGPASPPHAAGPSTAGPAPTGGAAIPGAAATPGATVDRGDRKPPGSVRQRFWQELKDGFRVPK